MVLYDLTQSKFQEDLNSFHPDHEYFILTSLSEFDQVRAKFNIHFDGDDGQENIDDRIKFENYESYDFISHMFFRLHGDQVNFAKVCSYYGAKFFILLLEDTTIIEEGIIERIKAKHYKAGDLPLLYYKIFNLSLSHMFDSLSEFESLTINVELQLIDDVANYEFGKVIALKGQAYEIKKYCRHLLYIGDQLVLNENEMIPSKMMRYFRGIDVQMNRVYTFSEDICEKAGHLVDLYDSAVTSRTNNMINKLTIFTVLLTPLMVISGIYGMNFANMPELQHEYGYYMVLGLMASVLCLSYLALKRMKLL